MCVGGDGGGVVWGSGCVLIVVFCVYVCLYNFFICVY